MSAHGCDGSIGVPRPKGGDERHVIAPVGVPATSGVVLALQVSPQLALASGLDGFVSPHKQLVVARSDDAPMQSEVPSPVWRIPRGRGYRRGTP